MDLWNQDDVDLVAPGFIAFDKVNMGSLGFIAVHGLTDCGYANLGLAAPKAPSCSRY